MFCGRPSLLVSSNSGSGITPRNLEHRRVNIQRAVGRELREKHWFSSQPSTNGSRLSKNYSRSVAPSSRFSRSRIFACTVVTSSFVSVRFFARYVNLYASDFPEAVAVYAFLLFQTGRIIARSQATAPLVLESRAEFQRASISQEQSSRCRA